MIAVIDRVGTHAPSGLCFVLARFWGDTQTGDPLVTNDFLLGLSGASTGPVVDQYGRWQTVSGQWVIPLVEVDGEWQPRPNDPGDPYATQDTTIPVPDQVTAVLAQFAALGLTGDLTDPGLEADVTDPAGLATDAVPLVGSTVTL